MNCLSSASFKQLLWVSSQNSEAPESEEVIPNLPSYWNDGDDIIAFQQRSDFELNTQSEQSFDSERVTCF